ncbi:hypothetical protein FK268_09160 [Tsukamurella sputi]|uniref:Uncharacterized protein n=1 Tax=Tsukamurella sputi TaxID=2591848 RepID=A0A5C5RRW1_9ACTN|nr:hypothetical protein [Tsukamurella sputi]TWS25350.1 hypothetical protein FK268_09160 [Tsukamurella sputi]
MYLAALQEDPELAEAMLGDYRPPLPSGEPPTFRGFTEYRYDNAKTHALLEQLIAVTGQADASGIQAVVPVPAVERMWRAQGLQRLRTSVAIATGRPA